MPLRLIALAFVVLLAGCGGATPGTGTVAGADVAPANALAFISIDTDQTSEQWKQADALLRKFTIRERLLDSLNEALSDETVDFSRDVLPVVGEEFDVVIVGVENGEPQVVGMMQPTNKTKLITTLEKQSRPPAFDSDFDGWFLVSDSDSAISTFKTQAAKGTLADDERFQDAVDELPDQANVKAYLSGAKLLDVVRGEVPELEMVPGGQELEWAAIALESTEEGWKLEGAAKSRGGGAQTYTPELLGDVPAGSLVALAFHGSDQAFASLRDNPELSQQLGELQRALGVSLTEVEQVLAGEGVLYVRQGSLFPEITLLLHPESASGALATLDRLAQSATRFDPSLRVARTKVGGRTVRKLTLGDFAVFWGTVGDKLVLSDSTAPFVARPDVSIEDDPLFTEARNAAGAPDETAGFLYLNVRDSVPLIQSLAQIAGEPLPLEVTETLAALQSFFAYVSAEGGLNRFSALLQVR